MDRVNWVTHECFNAITQLTQIRPHEAVQPALVHARMRAFVEKAQKRAREAAYSEQDSRLMTYAIVALADEVALSHSGPLREHWAIQPLQLLLFGENTAGDQFFVHLETVKQNPLMIDVLRVFYLCLVFGFQGRYRVRGAEVALSDVTDAVRSQLLRALAIPEVLAPNGPRPEEGRLVDRTSRVPVVWIGACLCTLACVLYLGLTVSLSEQMRSFVSFMSSAGG